MSRLSGADPDGVVLESAMSRRCMRGMAKESISTGVELSGKRSAYLWNPR